MEPHYPDLIPAGQENHPALADPELQAILADPRPESLPRIAALATELVARHAGIDTEPLVAEVLQGEPVRTELAAEITTYAARRRAAEASGDDADAERWFYRWHALRAVAASLDPDPAKAAWNVCWLGGNAVGGNFGDQLRLVVLSRLVDRATGAR